MMPASSRKPLAETAVVAVGTSNVSQPSKPRVHRVIAEVTASVSELKKNPMGTFAAADGHPLAVLNRNTPAFYCVSVKMFERMTEIIDDFELNAIANERLSDGESPVTVTLDEL